MTQNTIPMISLDPKINSPESHEANQSPDTSIHPWSMDTYADRLMDELFEEVDHILAGGEPTKANTSPQRNSQQAESKPPAQSPLAGLPTALARQFSLYQAPNQALTEETIDDLLAEVTHPEERRHQQNRWLDGLLLGSIFASVAATAIIWLSNRQEINQFFLNVLNLDDRNPASAIAKNPKAKADLQFIDYVQRSLENISRKGDDPTQVATASSSAASNNASGASNPNLPTVAVNRNLAQPANSPNVLERVYIPVYQPPQTLYAPQGSQLPVPPANILSSAPTAPAPPTVGKLGGNPVVSAPAKVHTLVGILNLGKKSAALFEIDGESQRIHAGERIGESGWTLVKILDQEAIVRRNGEVRSIYVGQQF